MATMLSVGNAWPLALLVTAGLVVTPPLLSSRQSGPATPDRIAFDRVQPDAALDVIGATDVGVTDDAVWVISRDSGDVTRLDPKTNEKTASVIPGQWPCAGFVAAFGSLWVPLCGEYAIARVDLESTTLQTATAIDIAEDAGSFASGVGSIWMPTGQSGTLARIDPDTNKAVAELYLPPGSHAAAFGHEALWVTSTDRGVVTRVDPHTNLIEKTIEVGAEPRFMAIGEDAVWVLNAGDGSVSRIDPKSNRVVASIPVSDAAGKGRIAIGEGSVWISAPGAPLTRIDPRRNRVAQVFEGDGGGPLAVGHKSIWLLTASDSLLRIDPRLVAALRPDKAGGSRPNGR
jgi:YVTN family beta-propeller protein